MSNADSNLSDVVRFILQRIHSPEMVLTEETRNGHETQVLGALY